MGALVGAAVAAAAWREGRGKKAEDRMKNEESSLIFIRSVFQVEEEWREKTESRKQKWDGAS
jgi:hypothetical protein